MQTLIIAGNIGKDAVVRNTQGGGDSVAGFPVAVDNGKDRDGNKRDATWYDCSLWGKRADALAPYLTKGSRITLTGRPTVRVHEGKAYLGVNVDQLTLQGGGQAREEPRRDTTPEPAYGGGAIEDEIPF